MKLFRNSIETEGYLKCYDFQGTNVKISIYQHLGDSFNIFTTTSLSFTNGLFSHNCMFGKRIKVIGHQILTINV